MRVFIDASAFISLLVETDTNHARAAEIAARLASFRASLITSSEVLGEVFTVLSMRFDKSLALKFGERIFHGDLTIIYADAEDFRDAWDAWKRESQKDVSFVDAMSFTLIASHAIDSVFSFDRHFRGKGFEVLR